MRRKVRAIILCGVCAGMGALIFLGSVAPAFGKCAKNDVFGLVPSPFRERLVLRLRLLIEYEKTEQWAERYELLHTPTVSKEDYIKQNVQLSKESDDSMIEFNPTTVSSLYPQSGIYLIEGCATKRVKGKLRNVEDVIEAHLVNEEWYFTSFAVARPNKRCKPKKK